MAEKPEGKAERTKKNIIRDLGPGVCVSFSASFMLFIFAPMEIYMANPGEFWYTAGMLFSYCLLMFLAAFGVSVLFFALAGLFGKKAGDVALAVYFTVFVGCYIQGNYMVSELPVMNGDEVDWGRYRPEQIKSLVAWIIVVVLDALLLAILKGEKFRRMVSRAAVFLSLVLGVTLAVLCVNGLVYNDEVREPLIPTRENEFLMSTDENFTILLLDAIDEGYFRRVWERHPEYEEVMADFTFYDNAMTGYPSTDRSMALMVSGEWFENGEPLGRYLQRAYRESPLFGNLAEHGYQLNLYEDSLLFDRRVMGDMFENQYYVSATLDNPVLFLKRQVKMVGLKYAPFVLKPHCMFDAHRLWNQRIVPEDDKVSYEWDNGIFYRNVQNGEITYTDRKQFKLIHLQGGHAPYTYAADVSASENGDYESGIEASMTIVTAYLEKLKAAGVYDNSALIILSDHGWDPLADDERGRQHPILFVKGIGEKHDLQVSGAPVSYADFAAACGRLLEGGRSDEIFDCAEGEQRDRRYLYFSYLDNSRRLIEYIQTGYAGDEDTMYATGNCYENE